MHQRESFKTNYKIGALKGNENMTYQNLWDVVKVILTLVKENSKTQNSKNRIKRHKINPKQAGERK